ncbi:MAG TPA: hypothetical protein VJV74_00105 [Terriglobia bacterium]|nr:hypothetical protein [Terriglobia bacterium]
MRCDEFQERLEDLEGLELSAPLREHAAGCTVCRAYLRDWRVARAGLRLLAAEPAPELPVGFAARLVRRLEETVPVRSGEEFLERVGRRFVYASLVLALTVLLFLLLPSSGPLRAPTTADRYWAGPETFAAESDLVLSNDTSGNQADVPAAAGEGEKTPK